MTEFSTSDFLSVRVPTRDPPAWEQKYPEGLKKHPEPISLGGGMPHSGFFPISSLDVKLKKKPFDKDYDDEFTVVEKDETSIDLKNGLQYANPLGLSHLSKFMSELVEKLHNPGYDKFKITVSSGNGNSINKALDAILDKDDVVLIDQFSYLPVMQHVLNFESHLVPLKVTNGVTDIEFLTNLLDNWSKIYPNLKKPKVFYVIPNGSNPFGIVQTDEQKQKIYDLLTKHNFMILEDDPYGYITLPKYLGDNNELEPINTDDQLNKYLDTIGTSYLKFDKVGRVIRVETFSKVYAPGLRLSMIVGHEDFINSITLYSFIVTGQLLSGPSQIILANTVITWGGVDGYLRWVAKVRNEYVRRVNTCLKILYSSKAYKEKKFTVMEPEVGMFLTLFFTKDISELLLKTKEKGVIVVDGDRMKVGELGITETGNTPRFIRITYASLLDGDLAEALQRLIEAIDDCI